MLNRILADGGTASEALVGVRNVRQPRGHRANQVCSKEEGLTNRTHHATKKRAKNGEIREDVAAPADKLEKLEATILKARSKAAKLKTSYDVHNYEVAEKYDAGMRYHSGLKPAWDAYSVAKEELEHAIAVED